MWLDVGDIEDSMVEAMWLEVVETEDCMAEAMCTEQGCGWS